uniref:SprG3 peptide n=1 Tax=Staphylococcus aureus TaxID=1280 RepID=A0A5B8KI18_STAAU|nr:sprG3 peptide [Staphylococcus aureus]
MSDFEMLMVVLTIIGLVLISNNNQKNNHSQLLAE